MVLGAGAQRSLRLSPAPACGYSALRRTVSLFVHTGLWYYTRGYESLSCRAATRCDCKDVVASGHKQRDRMSSDMTLRVSCEHESSTSTSRICVAAGIQQHGLSS